MAAFWLFPGLKNLHSGSLAGTPMGNLEAAVFKFLLTFWAPACDIGVPRQSFKGKPVKNELLVSQFSVESISVPTEWQSQLFANSQDSVCFLDVHCL